VNEVIDEEMSFLVVTMERKLQTDFTRALDSCEMEVG